MALAFIVPTGMVLAVAPPLIAIGNEPTVRVDKKFLVLISDAKLNADTLDSLRNIAAAKGIFILNIAEKVDGLDYVLEKDLTQQILANKEDLKQARGIIIWTDKNIGLNAMIAAAQSLNQNTAKTELKSFNFSDKYVDIITAQNFSDISAAGQSLYDLLKVQSIVLTRESAQTEIFGNSDVNNLVDDLRKNGEDYRWLGPHTERDASQLKYYNFLSYFIGYLVNHGVPMNTIYLILVLPIIATLIAFSRQIIGFKALGIYTPSIIAVSFLVTGLKYGIIIFLLTLAIGTLGRWFAQRIRIAYLPRMAIVLTVVSLALFIFFLLGARFEETGMLSLSIFPILIMVLLTEEFVALEIERGPKSAAILALETLALSVACYLLASWQYFKLLLLGYPEIILLTIVINIIIGRWTGLRLLEYYRFRKVIKNVELAEKK